MNYENRRIWRLAFAISAICVSASWLSPAGFALTVNVDFGATAYAGTAVTPNAGTYWNTVTGNSTAKTKTVSNLKDSGGNATTISLQVTTTGSGLKSFSDTSVANGNPNPLGLMRDYFYGGVFTNTFTGLPQGDYLLYLFAHGAGQTQGGTVTVSAANGGASGKAGNTGTEYRNLFAAGAEGYSYIKLPVTVGADGVLTFAAGNYLNGFQIYSVPVDNFFVNMTTAAGKTGSTQTISSMPGWGYSAAAQVPGETWNVFNETDFTPPNPLNIGEAWTVASGVPLTTAEGQSSNATMTVTYHVVTDALAGDDCLQTATGVSTVQPDGVMDQLMRNYWERYATGNFQRISITGLLPDTDYLLFVYGAAKGTSSRMCARIDLDLDGAVDLETFDDLSTDALFVDEGNGSYTITSRGRVWNSAVLHTDANGAAVFDSRSHLNGFQLTKFSAPVIFSQPAGVAANAGDAVALNVSANAGYPYPLSYQWYRNGSPIPGAVAATHTVSELGPSQIGTYWVTVSNQGKTLRSQWLNVKYSNPPTDPADALPPDGYAAASGVTGGAGGKTVTVRTAAELAQWAGAAEPCTILVDGTLDISGAFGADGKTIRVVSDKTIQGVDTSSTIIGCLSVGYTTTASMENIIIRKLSFYHPGSTIDPATGKYADGGDGISVYNARRVFITRCTFYDCADGACDITRNSDFVTVSWCKFVYSPEALVHRFPMILGNTDPTPDSTDPGYRVTLHHNWWADLCHERMPAGSYSAAHIYNNYFTATGNYYASSAGINTQWLVQNNFYDSVNNPLSKADGGKIILSGNIFQNCTGNPPGFDSTLGYVTVDDSIVMPPYSFGMQPVADVPSTVVAGAGAAGFLTSVPQTIEFGNLPRKALGDLPFTLNAIASSWLPVTYSSSNTSVATVSGATVSIVGVGSTSISASQPGNLTFAPAAVVARTLLVSSAEDAWVSKFGLDPTTNGAPGADPDGDGLPNALEFFLGGNPTTQDGVARSPRIDVAAAVAGGVVFEFDRAKQAADKQYVVEYTSELAGVWTSALDGVGGVEIKTVPVDSSTDRITVTIPTAADKIFVRLRHQCIM